MLHTRIAFSILYFVIFGIFAWVPHLIVTYFIHILFDYLSNFVFYPWLSVTYLVPLRLSDIVTSTLMSRVTLSVVWFGCVGLFAGALSKSKRAYVSLNVLIVLAVLRMTYLEIAGMPDLDEDAALATWLFLQTAMIYAFLFSKLWKLLNWYFPEQ
jgi:hypothetical protein